MKSHAKQGTETRGLVARSPFAGYPSYPEPMEEGMPANGTIIQVIGSTFDAQFPEDQLPAIYNAVKCSVTVSGQTSTLVGEVARHLGGGQVRCVALASTDGLRRGDGCEDTGAPLSVPVGEEVLGRVFNLLGEPIDLAGPVGSTKSSPIHREPPKFDQLNPKTEILETGIKVIDLLCPFVRGARLDSWWCWCGQDRGDPRNDRSGGPWLWWLLRVLRGGRTNP